MTRLPDPAPNPVASPEASRATLRSRILDDILAMPVEEPGQICDHICERLRRAMGARAAVLLQDAGDHSARPQAVQPAAWKAMLESSAGQKLAREVLQDRRISCWDADSSHRCAPFLAAVGARNALLVPLACGSGAFLVLDFDPAEDAGALADAMGPLPVTLGLMVQNALLRQAAPPCPREDDGDLRAIFDAVNDAIMVHEVGTGAILDVNQRMCEMFGLTYAEALWMDMGSLSLGLSPCTLDEAWAWMRKAVQEGPQTFEWVGKHKTGRLFWIEINLRLAVIGGKERLLATARDITDRKRTEAEQAARLKRSEAQNAVFLALTGVGLDFETTLELVAHHLAIQVGDLCAINILDETAGVLRPMAMAQPYIDGGALLPGRGVIAPSPVGIPGAGEVARTGQALHVVDPSGDRIKALVCKEVHPYLDHFGAHSLMMAPMRSQGRVIGTISLTRCGTTKPYSAEDMAMLQNLADRSALTFANARLYQENLRQAEQLRLANAELEKRVAERTAELERAMEALHRLAVEDTLTGLANRRRFNEAMNEEIRRARRGKSPLSLLMCDVDFFKRYNDAYGHQGGDECLRMVGAVMRDIFKRAGELPARYGGEEFTVVLPGLDREHALIMGERLRKAIEDKAMPHRGSDVAPCVTISIGIASASGITDEIDTDWFVARADEALYKSKAAGRNRVTCG